ncbi:isochorismate synthase [Jonesiaceae bacterium BS-20]|uniref:isochorismate synthase n=1 Tax=Jonesiaceae bacterium BS-20 TaxID=3120821 RepID=A0AAU7DTR6_9MICO
MTTSPCDVHPSPVTNPDLGSTASPNPAIFTKTIAIDLSDTALDALISLLPDHAPLAWVRRGDGIVGWGELDRIATTGEQRFEQAQAYWNAVRAAATIEDHVQLPGTGPVAFGSFAFSRASAHDSVLIIPKVVVGRRGETSWLTLLSTDPIAQDPVLDDYLAGRSAVTSPGELEFSDASVASTNWVTIVARAIERIKAGELEKIVLARDVTGVSQYPIDPRHLLSRLANGYENCWTFSVDNMVGATPELLVRTEKGLVTSRVLAGTIQRTADEETDTARAAILAHSSKDLEEHEYAVVSVATALKPYCTSLNVPETPFVLHLPNVLHLASDVTAVLDSTSQATSLVLAQALHPTAAVCGTPTQDAADVILEIEQMDRARYAGPVGWVGADGDGEWGIALRSGSLDPQDPNRIRLFAGCGIVAASDPQSELAETKAKLAPMVWALETK